MPLRVSAEALFLLPFILRQCFEYRVLCALIENEIEASDQL